MTTLPADFADRIHSGENPVRVVREYRGMSLEALAKAAGLSADFLEKVETGRRGLTDERQRKVAEALGVHWLELRKCAEHFSDCALTLRFMPEEEH